MAPAAPEAYVYKAFISYSHKDTAWARWLLQALETYRVPADLRSEASDPKARGVGRVFRDRDDASAAGDLKGEIQRALAASEHLIIVASPHSARSGYVEAEIEAFAAANARREVPGQILTLIVDGEPNISDGSASAERECFPPALRGGLIGPGGTPLEPLAADARPTGDGRTRALAKLVAALLGIRYDALVRRDLIRRRRTQWLAAAATASALAVAGVVAAVIVNGNLEQERLRDAQQNAERDARVVTAVSDAERGLRLNTDGNVEGAVALARQSLPLDNTLPFIPQAYDVLYQSVIQSTSAAQLDLGNLSYNRVPMAALSDGSYITVDESGGITIWAPTRGVIYKRGGGDPNGTLSVAPDGSAAFVGTAFGALRYDVATAQWSSTIAGSVIGGGFAAVSGDRLAICDGQSVALMEWPQADGLMPQNTWSVPIDGGCERVFRTMDGALFAESNHRLTELSPDTGAVVRSFDDDNLTFVDGVTATSSHLLVTTLNALLVFPREGGGLVQTIDQTVGPVQLSPGGRYAVVQNSILDGGTGFTVHDLDTTATHDIDCDTCRPGAFVDDNTYLALSRKLVSAFDVATGASKGDVHTLSTEFDSLAYLPAAKAIVAMRQLGLSEVALLNDQRTSPVFISGNDSTDDFLVGAALVGDHDNLGVALISRRLSESIDGLAHLHLFLRDADGTRREVSNPDLDVGDFQYGELSALAANQFALFIPDRMSDGTGRYLIFDSTTGARAWSGHLAALPELMVDGRTLLLEDDSGLMAYDLETRKTRQIAAGKVRWSSGAGRILVSDDTGLSVFTRPADGADAAWSDRRIATQDGILAICLTPDAQRYYVLHLGQDKFVLAQGSTETGEIAGTLDVTVKEEDAAALLYTDYALGAAFTAAAPVSCDPSRLVLRSIDNTALVWTIASNSIAIQPIADIDHPKSLDTGTATTSAALDSATLDHDDRAVELRDPQTRAVLATFSAGGARIAAAARLADQGVVAAGFESGRLIVWNQSYPAAPMIDLVAHGESIEALDARDGWIMTADQGGRVLLWPIFTPQALKQRVSDVYGPPG